MAGFQSLELKTEFARSLAISLALHALLIGLPPEPAGPDEKGAAIEARLRAPEVVEAVEAPPVAEPERSRRSVPAVQDQTPAPPAVISGVEAAPAPLPSAVATPLPEPPSAVVAQGIDADGLRQYRLGLAVGAKRFRQYPERARRAGWAGTAEVRVGVAQDGRPMEPKLVRSSGHEPLDAAAVAMLKGAAAHTPVPESLRGRGFSVVLPVVFDLEGE